MAGAHGHRRERRQRSRGAAKPGAAGQAAALAAVLACLCVGLVLALAWADRLSAWPRASDQSKEARLWRWCADKGAVKARAGGR